MKHNKKRNTAFIYETLSRELTKAIIEKDAQRNSKTVSIFKEFFTSGAILDEERRVYNVLLETKNVQKNIAERLLQESKTQHRTLNENSIFDAQSQLIAAINKGLGQDVWANFVPNFKVLASLDAIFNNKVSVKKRVLFEQAAVDRMSQKTFNTSQSDLRPVDALTYRTFIEKFNTKYETLLEEQKELLNNYIASFADDGFELRVYLNEELTRLKTVLGTAATDEEGLLGEKAKGVAGYLEGFRRREFTDSDLIKILKTQELVQELLTND